MWGGILTIALPTVAFLLARLPPPLTSGGRFAGLIFMFIVSTAWIGGILVLTVCHLLRNTPALIITSAGVIDNASLSAGGVGLLEWHEIDFALISKRDAPFVGSPIHAPTCRSLPPGQHVRQSRTHAVEP
jgi:hypothetical protein